VRFRGDDLGGPGRRFSAWAALAMAGSGIAKLLKVLPSLPARPVRPLSATFQDRPRRL